MATSGRGNVMAWSITSSSVGCDRLVTFSVEGEQWVQLVDINRGTMTCPRRSGRFPRWNTWGGRLITNVRIVDIVGSKYWIFLRGQREEFNVVRESSAQRNRAKGKRTKHKYQQIEPTQH